MMNIANDNRAVEKIAILYVQYEFLNFLFQALTAGSLHSASELYFATTSLPWASFSLQLHPPDGLGKQFSLKAPNFCLISSFTFFLFSAVWTKNLKKISVILNEQL